MMTFDQCITELYQKGYITEETALSYASRKAIVGRAIDAVKVGQRRKDHRPSKTSVLTRITQKKYGKM